MSPDSRTSEETTPHPRPLEDQERAPARVLGVLAIVDRIAAAISEAGLDVDAILNAVTEGLTREVGDACAARLLSEDEMRVVATVTHHRDREVLARLELEGTATDDGGAAAEALRTKASVVLPQTLAGGSAIGVPLIVHHRLFGALSLARDPGAMPLSREDLPLMETLARRTALALASARRHHELRRELVRLRGAKDASPAPAKEEPAVLDGNSLVSRRFSADLAILVEATRLLAGPEDPETALRALTRTIVGARYDFAAIECRLGDELQLHVAHRDPAREERVRELCYRWPERVQLSTTGKASSWVADDDGAPPASERDRQRMDVAGDLGLRAALFVPLVCRGELMGTLTMGITQAGRPLNNHDERLGEELGGRIAPFLERARLLTQAGDVVHRRGHFLAAASHELKTPLTSLALTVSGLVRSIRLGRNEALDPDRLSQRLARAEAQVGRITTILDEVLDASRLDAPRLLLAREEVDMVELAREAARPFRRTARISISSSGETTGRWDPDRLDRAMSHLVGNAIQQAQGKPIAIDVVGLADRVIVQIRDGGTSGEVRSALRECVPAAPLRDYGLDLGLWTIKRVVEAHGGRVSVENGPGGSVFALELPRSSHGGAAEPRDGGDSQGPGPRKRNVEDPTG